MDSHDDITQTANVVDVVGGSNVKGKSACFKYKTQKCVKNIQMLIHILYALEYQRSTCSSVYIWTYMAHTVHAPAPP